MYLSIYLSKPTCRSYPHNILQQNTCNMQRTTQYCQAEKRLPKKPTKQQQYYSVATLRELAKSAISPRKKRERERSASGRDCQEKGGSNRDSAPMQRCTMFNVYILYILQRVIFVIFADDTLTFAGHRDHMLARYIRRFAAFVSHKSQLFGPLARGTGMPNVKVKSLLIITLLKLVEYSLHQSPSEGRGEGDNLTSRHS